MADRIRRVFHDLYTLKRCYFDASIAPNQMAMLQEYIQQELDSLAGYATEWAPPGESVDALLLHRHLTEHMVKLYAEKHTDEQICQLFRSRTQSSSSTRNARGTAWATWTSSPRTRKCRRCWTTLA
jgi:hypothetical protein